MLFSGVQPNTALSNYLRTVTQLQLRCGATSFAGTEWQTRYKLWRDSHPPEPQHDAVCVQAVSAQASFNVILWNLKRKLVLSVALNPNYMQPRFI